MCFIYLRWRGIKQWQTLTIVYDKKSLIDALFANKKGKYSFKTHCNICLNAKEQNPCYICDITALMVTYHYLPGLVGTDFINKTHTHTKHIMQTITSWKLFTANGKQSITN